MTILLRIFLGLLLVVSVLAILACMYSLYKCGIVKLGAFKPDHPGLQLAMDYVTQHGGVDRVDRCSKRLLEILVPLALLALIILILTFTNPPPLP